MNSYNDDMISYVYEFIHMNSYMNSYKLWIHMIFSSMNSYVSWIHIWIQVYQGSTCATPRWWSCNQLLPFPTQAPRSVPQLYIRLQIRYAGLAWTLGPQRNGTTRMAWPGTLWRCAPLPTQNLTSRSLPRPFFPTIGAQFTLPPGPLLCPNSDHADHAVQVGCRAAAPVTGDSECCISPFAFAVSTRFHTNMIIMMECRVQLNSTRKFMSAQQLPVPLLINAKPRRHLGCQQCHDVTATVYKFNFQGGPGG